MLIPTGSDIEGPFYKPDAPRFQEGLGSRNLVPYPSLILSGKVMDTQGHGMTAVELDFWQANAAGEYDLKGFNLRGKIETEYGGHYQLGTIKPGFYKISEPGQPDEYRCSHIHVKLWLDGVCKLTTQLYFAHDKYDDEDHWFDPKRCITFASDEEARGTFDFVLSLE